MNIFIIIVKSCILVIIYIYYNSEKLQYNQQNYQQYQITKNTTNNHHNNYVFQCPYDLYKLSAIMEILHTLGEILN